MHHRPPPHVADRAVAALRRHGLVWLLLLALPLHGLSAAMIGLLGQRHFHDTVPSHALGRVLWQADLDAALRDETIHAHTHDTPQRHQHDRGDASVVALDPLLPDQDLDAGTSGAAPSMLAPPPSTRAFMRDDGHTPWSLRHTGWFVSWSSEPLERPPKA